MENRTGLFSNAVIWFGVAISVSEIQAGIGIGTMSSGGSLWIPLILGHLLGGLLLFLVGLIGARTRLNAMEVTSSTFGRYGSKFFAALNVLQLVAWVAVLNAQGASALTSLNLPISFPLICIILASLIALWVYLGINRIAKITTVVMAVLVLLLVVVSFRFLDVVPAAGAVVGYSPTLDFWNIFEISIAMPISWLPVISDYTKDVKKPVKATAVSAVAYTIASLWMYFIGVEIASIGPNCDIAQAILLANLGVSGIIIVVLSTITTNFLAANSAGESAKVIYNRLNPKVVGIVVSGLSAVIAISGIMNHYIDFLYLISSVFGPMAAVLLVSFYLGKDTHDDIKTWYWNIFSWFAGFIVYYMTGFLDSVVLGPSLLAIIVSAVLAYVWILFRKYNFKKER